MNFQVTVLKILVSYPEGFATLADLKRDMAILATSGLDWSERTKRLAMRAPGLDIFSQKLVERADGGWRITELGRSVLAHMEARPSAPEPLLEPAGPSDELSRPIRTTNSLPPNAHKRRQERRLRRRAARAKARSTAP